MWSPRLYASFVKGQGHRGILSLVKGTLWGNWKFLLRAFQGHQGNDQGAWRQSLLWPSCKVLGLGLLLYFSTMMWSIGTFWESNGLWACVHGNVLLRVGCARLYLRRLFLKYFLFKETSLPMDRLHFTKSYKVMALVFAVSRRAQCRIQILIMLFDIWLFVKSVTIFFNTLPSDTEWIIVERLLSINHKGNWLGKFKMIWGWAKTNWLKRDMNIWPPDKLLTLSKKLVWNNDQLLLTHDKAKKKMQPEIICIPI